MLVAGRASPVTRNVDVRPCLVYCDHRRTWPNEIVLPEQVKRLNAVRRIEMGFPLDFFATEMVCARSSGGMRDQIDA